jgi:hypothetical protein
VLLCSLTSSSPFKKIKEFLWNCGYKDAIDGAEYFRPTLSQFMKMITRDGLAHGRIAVERIYAPDPNTGKKRLVAFRPVDSGTIYHIISRRSLDQSTRDNAIRILSQLKNEKIRFSTIAKICKNRKCQYCFVKCPDCSKNNKCSKCMLLPDIDSYDHMTYYNKKKLSFWYKRNISDKTYDLTPIDIQKIQKIGLNLK